MTNRFTILAIAFAASACAGRPQRPTTTVRYACGDGTVVLRDGETLTVDVGGRPSGPAELRWTDADGDHFVIGPGGFEAVEYVVPLDARKDAIVKRYDASAGYASSDWRLFEKRVCRAHGGYNDALARWMNGDSLDKVADDLALEDRSEARGLVRKALSQLHRQYHRDR
jgi:hypothetical protein